VVALYFHACTVVLSIGPLAAGWPQRATLPSASDAALLGAIAVTSFAGQLLLTRGFQLESASRAASINFSQASFS
jgi:drug/metabolite transporter (DMT)-like permease